MKATLKNKLEFTPIVIELTIESRAEQDFLIEFFGNLTVSKAEDIARINCPDSHIFLSIYNALTGKSL